ncbi:U3 small nucleolar RNA-associated protein 11 [Hesseltinella vesiculosa]|uniref:U3 small nucleolar RNA-associated protein 11 n=1 Tax=Hesseltinella vesiculosa TaxID=101127 RepID=A0A1X2GEH9_9FUNG|nr:U3 small nucleolar RNA-associated protein 11 [Hesseltinella vesiculosa]
MSSLRNSVQRRNHKERGQLAGREHLGLLEKKKDYLLRAKDYHSKEKRIKALREKALFRNPDEFYFKMINSKTNKGVHIQQRNEELPDDMVQLMKSQDKNYIRLQRNISKRKMDLLENSLHFMDNGETEAPKAKRNKHIVFADSDKTAKRFDPVKHLDTAPELVNRTFNRPRMDTLKKMVANQASELSMEDVRDMKRARELKYRELASRKNREHGLGKAERELDTQKALRTKGARKKVGTDSDGLAVYKWRAERKR